jgi:hypothetical protein
MEGVGEVILLSWSDVYRNSLFVTAISIKKQKADFSFSISIEAGGT